MKSIDYAETLTDKRELGRIWEDQKRDLADVAETEVLARVIADQ
jgi:hypothetical protein